MNSDTKKSAELACGKGAKKALFYIHLTQEGGGGGVPMKPHTLRERKKGGNQAGAKEVG